MWLPFSNAAIMIINIHCKFNKLKIKKKLEFVLSTIAKYAISDYLICVVLISNNNGHNVYVVPGITNQTADNS